MRPEPNYPMRCDERIKFYGGQDRDVSKGMREAKIEAYLVKQIHFAEGRAYKWVSPGNNGVPDRLIAMPEGLMIFCELKAFGNMPTGIQWRVMQRLTGLGHECCWLDSKAGVDALMDRISEYYSDPW